MGNKVQRAVNTWASTFDDRIIRPVPALPPKAEIKRYSNCTLLSRMRN